MIWGIIFIGVIAVYTAVIIHDGVEDWKKYKSGDGWYYNSYGEYTRKKPSFWKDFGYWITGVFAYSLIVFVLVFFITALTYNDKFTHYEQQGQWNIYAFSDNTVMSGRVYLMSARFEEELCYYYVANSAYGQKVYKVSSSDTYLNYVSENETCYMEKYERVYNDTFWNRLLIPRFFNFEDSSYYIAYIPEGSVSTEFQVDLK